MFFAYYRPRRMLNSAADMRKIYTYNTLSFLIKEHFSTLVEKPDILSIVTTELIIFTIIQSHLSSSLLHSPKYNYFLWDGRSGEEKMGGGRA